jgi:uncharacterized coiled-coil protein SlyX
MKDADKDQAEKFDLLIKLIMSQTSQLEKRILNLERKAFQHTESIDYIETKHRSKLDYLLKEIQKLRG